MSEISEMPKEIGSVVVKVGGEKQRLILTENYISIHCKKWFVREDTSFIPLNSVDSIFFGWKRYPVILMIAIFLIIGGMVAHQIIATIVGGLFIFLFLFYKPHLLLVRSSKETLGGNPLSEDEANKFIATFTSHLDKRK